MADCKHTQNICATPDEFMDRLLVGQRAALKTPKGHILGVVLKSGVISLWVATECHRVFDTIADARRCVVDQLNDLHLN